jgi:hypothetical protein
MVKDRSIERAAHRVASVMSVRPASRRTRKLVPRSAT